MTRRCDLGLVIPLPALHYFVADQPLWPYFVGDRESHAMESPLVEAMEPRDS